MAERRIESGDEGPDAAAGDAVAGDAAGTGGAEPAAYRVGKGRPPTGRRFAKGQSGNPRGRPKMRGGSGKPGDRLIGADQPTRRMILEEAYRTITVRDGDEEIQMTANRAVFRAMMERALKGSRPSRNATSRRCTTRWSCRRGRSWTGRAGARRRR